MSSDYLISGVPVHSSLPLPGVCEAGPLDGAAVELDLVAAAELELAWSGPASEGSWRGSLRDGAELTIAWGSGGDLLFGYGDLARFHLDRERGRLRCAVTDPGELGWQRVLLTRVLPLVAISRGCEALHAGAVETEAGVVAVAATSGTGKSTLTAELVGRGHRLFADDVLVLAADQDGTRAYPASPHLSLAEAGSGAGTELEVLGGKRWVAVADAATAPAPVAAVAIFERGRGELPRALKTRRSPLALAPYMLGLPDDEGRDRERFRLYADLVDEAWIVQLTAAAADSPAAIAAELEAALELPAPAPAGAG
jgi:hypothetical protein